jgi:TolB-like protein/tetratricopeptide (TPR) repeat protein
MLGVQLAVGVVAVAALLLTLNVGGWRERLFSRPQFGAISSLAVLPLENVSRDPDEEYFVDGMTEALISDLAKIGGLKVISPTSVLRYKGTTKSLPEIAKELNVEAVVGGSVLRVGEQVRITAHLIRAATDEHLWAESYVHDLRDVLRLHSEVARTIAQQIKVTLTPQEQARMVEARSVNPKAYQAYLKGRFYWNKRSKIGGQNAIEHFGVAIKLDPGYAPAFAGLADSYTVLARNGHVSPKEAFPLAKQAALKAIELDHESPEAHGALAGIALNFDWDWTVAERELLQALDLNPSYEEAHHQYSHLFMTLARSEESLSESRRALEVNPLDPLLNVHLGWHFMMNRQYDDAIAQLKSVLEMDRFQALRYRVATPGAPSEAITAGSRRQAGPENAQALAACRGLCCGGPRPDAQGILRHLEDWSQKQYVSAYEMPPYVASTRSK